MKAISRKLKSERGASVVFALVTFLVAAMVCALIVNTAVTNTYRIRSGKKQEQANLTVQSAAELLKNAFQGDEIQIETTTVSCPEEGTSEMADFSIQYLESSEKDRYRENPYADVLLSFAELLWKDSSLAEGQKESYPLGRKVLVFQTENLSQRVQIEAAMTRTNTAGTGSDIYEVTMHLNLETTDKAEPNCLVTMIFSAVLEEEEPHTESRQISFSPVRTETTQTQISHLRFSIQEARQGR